MKFVFQILLDRGAALEPAGFSSDEQVRCAFVSGTLASVSSLWTDEERRSVPFSFLRPRCKTGCRCAHSDFLPDVHFCDVYILQEGVMDIDSDSDDDADIQRFEEDDDDEIQNYKKQIRHFKSQKFKHKMGSDIEDEEEGPFCSSLLSRRVGQVIPSPKVVF